MEEDEQRQNATAPLLPRCKLPYMMFPFPLAFTHILACRSHIWIALSNNMTITLI